MLYSKIMNKGTPITFSIIGSILLAISSSAQKYALGIPLTWPSFIVPILFGAISGFLIGLWYCKSRKYLHSLKQNETRLKAILEGASVGIVLADNNHNFLSTNPAFCNFVGYTEEELQKMTFREITHPADISANSQLVDQVHAGKIDEYSLDKRYITKDGRTVWGQVSVAVVEEKGQSKQFIAICKDITKEKLTEQKLSFERHFNQAMLDTVGSLIMVMDKNGQIVRFNKACENLTGYSLEEVKGRYPWDFLLPPEVRTTVQGVFGRLAAGDFPNTHQNEWLTRSGERRIINWSNTATLDENNGVEYVIATGADITEHIKTESELRRLNENNQLLLNSAGEGIFGIDREGLCTFINRAGQELFGYPANELIGKKIHLLTHHTHADGSPYPESECEIQKVFRNGEGIRVNDEIMWRKDGTSFPAEYSAYPMTSDGEISGTVIVFRNVTDEHAMVRKMNYLASHDALTGLGNRYAFERKLQQALENTGNNQQHTLCYLDLDQFKVVNDTCGHVAGDEMLRQLSTILTQHLRQGDTLGRLGGDEFGLLLEDCSIDDAHRVVNDLRSAVQEFRYVWDDKTFAVTLSAGMVLIDVNTPSVTAALSHADTACYAAKESGRNRVHIHHPDNKDLVRRHGEMQWVSRIHEAYEENRFYLRRQKIFSIGNELDGKERFEILIGLRDRNGKLVPPGAFLPAAERYNLMPTMDRWVVRTALKWLVTALPDLDRLDFCTINLSGTSLADEHFADFVVQQLHSSGIEPHKLCFEITETAAIADLPRALRFMTELRILGCLFALDDFGSGMSSFAYLKNLPVDILKIDGTFVRDITHDPVDRAMVEAINQVGHVMGLETVAEYVEDEAILNTLKQIGVDYAQGYGVGMPEELVWPNPSS